MLTFIGYKSQRNYNNLVYGASEIIKIEQEKGVYTYFSTNYTL